MRDIAADAVPLQLRRRPETPSGTKRRLRALLAPIAAGTIEYGIALYVAADGRLLAMRHVAGHRTGVDLPVRGIVADALATGCRQVVIAHNHPGGNADPSGDDLRSTAQLRRALSLIEVALVDHVILAAVDRRSLRDAGYL